MHKQLIILAFKKARKEEIEKGIKKPSDTSLAKGLSFFIEENSGFTFGEKSLRNYYNSALKENEETNIKQPKVINSLCKYLEYENYEQFNRDKKIIKTEPKEKVDFFQTNKKNKLIGTSIIAIFISYLSYDMTKKDCMIWVNNNHYEKVSCEEKANLQPVTKDIYVLENFKRVKPDSTYPFFKINGQENLWYERNAKGDLEYFTSYGRHPITGKTLKKITPYMIKNYIWSGYEY